MTTVVFASMNVVILGGKGYLGQKFLEVYPDAYTPSLDIGDAQAVGDMLDDIRPDVVINCAGKTGRPNIDWCEEHKEETLYSNLTGPLVLLRECAEKGIYWVHIGSGCIYEGDNGGEGFTEEDEPNYRGSFYSRTKLWSDAVLREFPVLNLRLRMPFDGEGGERSLITKISKYDRLLDVKNSMTYVPDFLDVTAQLIERRKTGTYNVVNPGVTSPFEIMTLYKGIVDPSHSFEKLNLDDLSDVAKTGRSNCVLSSRKLESEGLSMRPIEDAVRHALEMMKNA